MTTLVCIHGRGQHGNNPNELRRRWMAGLNFGLTMAGRKTVDAEKVVFPFYGDLLEKKKNEAVRTGANIQLAFDDAVGEMRLDPLMPQPIAELESDLLKSMGEQAGVELLQFDGFADALLRIPAARRILQFLADKTNIDQEVIESFLTDVAVYFRTAREDVLNLVRAELPNNGEPLVIIGHSLGSLVAHDLLQEPSISSRTDLLVTAGSPLGLQACYRNLLAGGPRHPAVPKWSTAYDVDDVVALGHPLQPLYGVPLDDLTVDNPPQKAHSIESYLSHPPVAAGIADVLT